MFSEEGFGDREIFSPSVNFKSVIPVTRGVKDCNPPVLNEELSDNLKNTIEADSPIL
jgi:hypothetical protein